MSQKKIERVAVIGSGAMGTGIGLEFARFGYPVALYDLTDEILKMSMQNALADFDLMVETELISASTAKAALGRMRPATDLADAVSGADHVVEAAPEDLSLKQALFAKLDELCPASVSLASNSSGFRADDIAAQVKNHQERILITHYWWPPQYMPLVEVIGGKRTDPAVLKRVARLLRGLRKRVVVQELELPTRPAGWGNALQWVIGEKAQNLIADGGCTPDVVDDLIRFGFGRRMPFVGNYIRLDLLWLVGSRPPAPRLGRRGTLVYDWPGDKAKQVLRNFNMELIRLMKMDMEKGDI